ncbi:MAG: NAD-dependent deacylase [Chlorobi bacterium]|nr:NAD-dependent deacylase [Chlorobiota bacterium]
MDAFSEAVETLRKSKHTTAFTGAGISVESGIPPFRGPEGLWSKYDPRVLDIDYFYNHPAEAWKVIREIFYDFFGKAKPNPAHFALADMEKAGLLSAVITQNIDNLHQEAGSKTVYEYHGNSKRLVCPKCGKKWSVDKISLEDLPPRCPEDQAVLKPDFIFFGEGIPPLAARKSEEEAYQAEVFLLIGTTGEVMPAAMIPRMARNHDAVIIEINPQPSAYTYDITDIYLRGKAGDTMNRIVRELRS